MDTDYESLLTDNAALATRVRTLERQVRIARDMLALLDDVGKMVGQWAPDVARRTLRLMDGEHWAGAGDPPGDLPADDFCPERTEVG